MKRRHAATDDHQNEHNRKVADAIAAQMDGLDALMALIELQNTRIKALEDLVFKRSDTGRPRVVPRQDREVRPDGSLVPTEEDKARIREYLAEAGDVPQEGS